MSALERLADAKQKAQSLLDAGDRKGAEVVLEQMVALARWERGDLSFEYGFALRAWAGFQAIVGERKAAINTLRAAVPLLFSDQTQGADAWRVSLVNLIGLEVEFGHVDQAVEDAAEAIRLATEHGEWAHEPICNVLPSLSAMIACASPAKALGLYPLARSLFGSNPKTTLYLSIHEAKLAAISGEPDRANTLYDAALHLAQGRRDTNPPLSVSELLALSHVGRDCGRFEEALQGIVGDSK